MSEQTMGLVIRGSGMCCSVGLSTLEACAAIHVGAKRLSESEFSDADFEPVVIAHSPFWHLRGPKRLAAMVARTLEESLAGSSSTGEVLALWLLTARPTRVGTHARATQACVEACTPYVSASANVRVMPLGEAGLVEVLEDARALLARRPEGQVLVCAVDSLLSPQAVNYYLRRKRINSTGAADGFIPGEGAASVLLGVGVGVGVGGGEAKVVVTGVGAGQSSATITNEGAQTADGLVSAMRVALRQSGRLLSEVDFRIANISGESYFFTELALSLSRVLDRRVPEFPLLHITDSTGHTGTAAGVLALAYLAGGMPRGYTPGSTAVVQLMSDERLRGAIVVEFNP